MPTDPCPRKAPPHAPWASHVLWCGECGATLACSPGDVLRYARGGWPRCCGRVMYYGPAGDPRPPPRPRDCGEVPTRPPAGEVPPG
jgi:hypothetical protein